MAASNSADRAVSVHRPAWPARIVGLPDRIPFPRPATYLLLIGAGAVAGLPVGWFLESYRGGALLLQYAYYGAVPVALLCIMHDLDRQAFRAFDLLAPMLTFDDEERAAARARLVHLPPVPVLVSAAASLLLTFAYYRADPVTTGVEGLSAARLLLRWCWESMTGAMFFVLAVHTVLQLRTIDWIHRRLGEIDLFDQARVRAFSTVTSRTGIALIIVSSPSALVLPSEGDLSVVLASIGWLASVVLVALISFALPLWHVRSQIAARKAALQGEIGRRISEAIASSHAAMDRGDTATVDVQQRNLAALTSQRVLVEHVSVWPWSTAASSRLVTAVLLPVCVWFLTRALDRVV